MLKKEVGDLILVYFSKISPSDDIAQTKMMYCFFFCFCFVVLPCFVNTFRWNFAKLLWNFPTMDTDNNLWDSVKAAWNLFSGFVHCKCSISAAVNNKKEQQLHAHYVPSSIQPDCALYLFYLRKYITIDDALEGQSKMNMIGTMLLASGWLVVCVCVRQLYCKLENQSFPFIRLVYIRTRQENDHTYDFSSFCVCVCVCVSACFTWHHISCPSCLCICTLQLPPQPYTINCDVSRDGRELPYNKELEKVFNNYKYNLT